METTIRYYKIEMNSKEMIASIENNLQRYILGEKRSRIICGPSQSKLEDKASELKTEDLVYSLDSFDVLFKSSRITQREQRHLFSKTTPAKIELELIVQAGTDELLDLQQYLANSGATVLDARKVETATFTCATARSQLSEAWNYSGVIKLHAERGYPGVDFQYVVDDEKSRDESRHLWNDYTSRACYRAIFSGKVDQILKLRKTLLGVGLGISIESHEIQFN